MQVHNPSQIATHINEMEFYDLGAFNEGSSGMFWSQASGWSPWEMHPGSEELLHIIEGEIELEVLLNDSDSKQIFKVKTGDFIIIPRGHWHRQKLITKTKEYYLTPGATLHSQSADPRKG